MHQSGPKKRDDLANMDPLFLATSLPPFLPPGTLPGDPCRFQAQRSLELQPEHLDAMWGALRGT